MNIPIIFIYLQNSWLDLAQHFNADAQNRDYIKVKKKKNLKNNRKKHLFFVGKQQLQS